MATLKPSEIQTKLTKEQKQAIGLLSIGTFLEYFDLMIYVHMAVVLNELFFPKVDPYMAQLLAAFAFCSTFVMRPFGAIIFGWIGDNIGRKAIIIITTTLMAFCCLVMALLPTYEQIGITASFMMLGCRILQGMACMGELVGAEIYLTENIKPPIQYPAVGCINIFSSLGTTVALIVAYLVTLPKFQESTGLTWRSAFVLGAVVALIGTVARTALKESTEFVKAKQVIKDNFDVDIHTKLRTINIKTLVAYFFIQCARPLGFYFIYVYCTSILRNTLGFDDNETFGHNFIVSAIDLGGMICLVFLSYKIYPLKIIRTILILFSLIMIPIILFVPTITTPGQLMLIQGLACLLWFDHSTAIPIFYRHFPLLRRFTSVSLVYAMSRALMYGITAFGTVVLIDQFGNRGILILIIPTAIGFYISLNYFKNLEIAAGNYPQ